MDNERFRQRFNVLFETSLIQQATENNLCWAHFNTHNLFGFLIIQVHLICFSFAMRLFFPKDPALLRPKKCVNHMRVWSKLQQDQSPGQPTAIFMERPLVSCSLPMCTKESHRQKYILGCSKPPFCGRSIICIKKKKFMK